MVRIEGIDGAGWVRFGMQEEQNSGGDTCESVFLNGAMMTREEANLSAFDASVQHGVGLFETMHALSTADGVVVDDLDAHMDRLQESSAMLGLSDDLKTGALGEAVEETVRRARYKHTRVRLTVTGGDLNMLQSGGGTNHRPTVLIQAQPATAYPDEMFESGVMATIAEARSNPLDPTAGHKTLNYWWRLRELQAAAAKGAAESIVLQVSNHLSGGCVSNLFVVQGGKLVTPIVRGEESGEAHALPSPVLPGITRARVMETAKKLGIGVEVRMMSIDDLLDADEVFLTNSSWKVLPIVKVEAEVIGNGEPGGVTNQIRGGVLG
jgi:branched-chain amino acid aminotransferase